MLLRFLLIHRVEDGGSQMDLLGIKTRSLILGFLWVRKMAIEVWKLWHAFGVQTRK